MNRYHCCENLTSYLPQLFELIRDHASSYFRLELNYCLHDLTKFNFDVTNFVPKLREPQLLHDSRWAIQPKNVLWRDKLWSFSLRSLLHSVVSTHLDSKFLRLFEEDVLIHNVIIYSRPILTYTIQIKRTIHSYFWRGHLGYGIKMMNIESVDMELTVAYKSIILNCECWRFLRMVGQKHSPSNQRAYFFF
jgi:hypothetical protein